MGLDNEETTKCQPDGGWQCECVKYIKIATAKFYSKLIYKKAPISKQLIFST